MASDAERTSFFLFDGGAFDNDFRFDPDFRGGDVLLPAMFQAEEETFHDFFRYGFSLLVDACDGKDIGIIRFHAAETHDGDIVRDPDFLF